MTRHEVVLGRIDFDETMAVLLREPARDSQPGIGIGHAVPDNGGATTRWRVGALRAEAFDAQSAWALRLRQAMAARPHAAILLLQLGAADLAPPASAADWQAWLLATAPAYRLLCAGRDPAVLGLWLDMRGHAAGAVRLERQWHPLAMLSLPGPGMVRLPLTAGSMSNRPADTVGDLADGRYSRLAGALGPEVLSGWQRSVFAVVGAGRTGSLVVHTLARSGASVVLMDPDRVEAHNLCGDLLPQHEGLHKADAVARFVRPLLRSGAFADPRSLDIGDRAAGLLLIGCDALISCVDDDRARLWAAAWCAALLLPHLDIGVAARLQGDVGADLRLIVPGRGCLACVGGFARPQRLPLDAAADALEPAAGFLQQRAGSLRTWAQVASHAGLRLLELMHAGRLPGTVFRRMQEDAIGTLRLIDSATAGAADCPLCGRFTALGRLGVDGAAVHAVAAALRERNRVLAAAGLAAASLGR
jgi:hypothetical protein